jgi:hypothetical protein
MLCVGVKLAIQTKEELLTSLKIAITKPLGNTIPLTTGQQLNEQQYTYDKNGHLQFSHPQNSHDDMTWTLAIAVAHSMQMPSSGTGAVMLPRLERVNPFSSPPF